MKPRTTQAMRIRAQIKAHAARMAELQAGGMTANAASAQAFEEITGRATTAPAVKLPALTAQESKALALVNAMARAEGLKAPIVLDADAELGRWRFILTDGEGAWVWLVASGATVIKAMLSAAAALRIRPGDGAYTYAHDGRRLTANVVRVERGLVTLCAYPTNHYTVARAHVFKA